jgi:adenine-specific DNA methylase
VACPTTGKPVPLSPNWWLSKGSDTMAVKLVAEAQMDAPSFVILKGDEVKQTKPDEGTISRGVGRSPWTGETISGDYIKAEAQAGRMGQLLYAIAIKKPGSGFAFRAPTAEDVAATHRAEAELSRKKPGWIAQDLIPSEEIGISNYDRGHRLYGIYKWTDFFIPRQLAAIAVYVETMREVMLEADGCFEKERLHALQTYFGVMLDKIVIYNNRSCRFDPGRGIRSSFDKHNFSFVWSHAEFDASANLLPWAVDQVFDAYKELSNLVNPAQKSLLSNGKNADDERLSIFRGSASSIHKVPDNTVFNITVDPPYYDNVQYAELADFFYVWLKRSVGHLFPEFFSDELTNKDDEAVANPARFESLGRKKKELAEQDYEHKMAAAFREMHRVLHPHGVLTVMFTHKRVEAWDTLASALIGAGFTIKASWPVHTESEHSLHQAKKNAAASTILLVCRKRGAGEQGSRGAEEPVWWDDIQGRVRRVARAKAQDYLQQGISGVDLYISTFGPTLSVISEQWPVLTSEIDPKTGEAKPLRPETALDLAREEVVRLRKEGLLAGKAIEFDPVTDWTIMAWDAFQAEEFPYDEARKLAIALGLEMDDLMRRKKLVTKKGQYVVLQKPRQRRKKGMVDPDAALFEHHIDALHTAMLIYEEDGTGACDVFLQNRGLKRDTTFRAGLQALINAIPRTKVKNKFVRPEADVLDRMRLAFYADELTVPPEEEPPMPQAQQLGFGFDGEDEEK